MGEETGNWCLIESDPGVFTELINDMGVKDVQMEELYSLDADTLRQLSPVYGLIFLFKWQSPTGGQEKQKDIKPADPIVDHSNVFFAQQIIHNACATQAILSILLNRAEDIDIGTTLTNFRSFALDFPPEMRGLALSNCDEIRQVHNSFVRPDSLLTDLDAEKRMAGENDDVFHFVSYVPIGGRLYELDGLQPGPIDHGKTGDWLADVGEVIQQRMAQYNQEEIRFNLMALIGDRRKVWKQQISSVEADIVRLTDRLEQLRVSSGGDQQQETLSIESQLAELNDELENLQLKVDREEDKFANYRFENKLRKHNFIPLIYQLIRGMAKKDVLETAIEEAKK